MRRSTESKSIAGVPGLALRRDGARTAWSLLSRGDRVHGCTVRPTGRGPHPVILLAGPDGCASSAFVESAASAWCAHAALVTFDLPLCGARKSDKLSALALGTTTALAKRLRPEIEAQVAADLAQLLGLVATDPALDETRVTFVGVGLGAKLARAFAAAPNGVARLEFEASANPKAIWFRKIADRVTRPA